jgi:hypothetical protein
MRTAKLTLILLVSSLGYASAQIPQVLDRDADRDQILHSLSEIAKGYVARDAGPFEELYLEKYVSIREKPVFNTREQLIAMMVADSAVLKARRKPDYDTISYENERPDIRFFGSTAVLHVGKRHYWQYRGMKCLTRSLATELWVKRDSEWKIAASHGTTFQCDPKPFHPIHSAVSAFPPITKPPPNADKQAEQQVRDLINSFVRARNSSRELFDALVAEYVSKDFTATNAAGEIGRDRTLLEMFPASTPTRTAGIRGSEEAIIIYDNAAVFTFKLRPPLSARLTEKPQQCSVYLAKVGEKWMIVAAHAARYSAEH